MSRRRTIAGPVEIDGIGLHSGEPVRMRLVPAAAGNGVVFVRTDLGSAEVPARLEHVGPSFWATVIERDSVSVSTIEHLMAALCALQVDDVRVEVDAGEVPILDGSSRPFVEAILDRGFRDLDVPREFLTVVRPMSIEDEDKRIAIFPSSEFRVTYAIDFEHPVLGYQELTVSVWRGEEFRKKLAPARTFTFECDVEALRRRGLAKGGSLDNAVVIGTDGILNGELRFADEFVRHKMLDLTGDLALVGHPIKGHVVAYRAGHDLHGRLARRILETPDGWFLAREDEVAVGAPVPRI